MESIGQTNHVLLNISTDYNPLSLGRSIKRYFEKHDGAVEVLIYKGNKAILIKRSSIEDKSFLKTFVRRYNK